MLPEKVVVLSSVGYPDERISYGGIGELKGKELGEAPFCIVIPSELHGAEKEYLSLFGS